MHWTLQVTIGLVAWACIGGLWRPSALALVGAWGLAQGVYLVTGSSLPIALYWLLDPLCILVIWRTIGTKLDYVILAGFPVCWWAYLSQTGADQWWTLWAVSSVQFFLAGPIPHIQKVLFSVSHGPRRATI